MQTQGPSQLFSNLADHKRAREFKWDQPVKKEKVISKIDKKVAHKNRAVHLHMTGDTSNNFTFNPANTGSNGLFSFGSNNNAFSNQNNQQNNWQFLNNS